MIRMGFVRELHSLVMSCCVWKSKRVERRENLLETKLKPLQRNFDQTAHRKINSVSECFTSDVEKQY